LESKVAIVTGGASGFGECTVRLFTKHGAKVVIADVQDELGISLCEELLSKSGNVMYVHCDVTNDLDVKNVVDTTVSKYGKLDIMFNNAARVLIPAKSGVILFTSSVSSVIACGVSHAYSASKHSIIGLIKNLCVELGEYGIRVNFISPCGITTPLLVNEIGMEKKIVEELVCESALLKGAVPTADDMAEAAVYLASDEGKFVSGLN
nr:hypothetical protein [Tanacetum cinerariifolium]